jgi:hypothetical protein
MYDFDSYFSGNPDTSGIVVNDQTSSFTILPDMGLDAEDEISGFN